MRNIFEAAYLLFLSLTGTWLIFFTFQLKLVHMI